MGSSYNQNAISWCLENTSQRKHSLPPSSFSVHPDSRAEISLSFGAHSSCPGFSQPLTIWLVEIAAQTWSLVSALQSGLACNSSWNRTAIRVSHMLVGGPGRLCRKNVLVRKELKFPIKQGSYPCKLLAPGFLEGETIAKHCTFTQSAIPCS